MNPDGSGATDVSNDPQPDDATPSWSPDGAKIAYSLFDPNAGGGGEIYVMNANGSAQTNLTNDPADDYAPTWSPDGVQIAFSTNRAAVRRLRLRLRLRRHLRHRLHLRLRLRRRLRLRLRLRHRLRLLRRRSLRRSAWCRTCCT